MKKLLTLLICAPFFLKAQNKQGIQFKENLSWAQIQQKAKAENKYIFVDAFATWCGPCKMMDKEVYSNLLVGQTVNDKFIAVKVQMDETAKDDEQIKSWYADAQEIKKIYGIAAFPSFLFFSPDGKLLHKDFGYRNVDDFINLIHLALDPANAEFYEQLKAYQKGKIDYRTMGNLAVFVKTTLNNKTLADKIAKDYKKYLDKQPLDTILKKESLSFISSFMELTNSRDLFFKLCFQQADTVGKIMNDNRWASYLVNQTINREEIESKVLKNGKPIAGKVDWNKILRTIHSKYFQIDAKKMVLDYQVYYYYQIDKDWQQWAFYTDQRIKAYPPQAGLQSFMELNMPAWNTFLHCNDRQVLAKALEWSELSIKLGSQPKDLVQLLDTKANLLYKLGKTQEAIEQEEKAVALCKEIIKGTGRNKHPFEDEFVANVSKMKNGVPTWPAK